MSCDSPHSSKFRKESIGTMKDRSDGLNVSKKIHVNPLIAGSNIHYNRGKYTLANSTSGVTESTASVLRNEAVHYNPKFLGQTYAYKKDNVHYNPNYVNGSSRYVTTTSHAIHVNPNFIPVSRSVQPYSSTYQTWSYSSSSLENANKYKFVRKEGGTSFVASQGVSTVQKCEPKTASKYKLVYSTAPSAQPAVSSPIKPGVVIRSKYTLRTCLPNSTTSVPTSSAAFASRENKKRITYDFKRISRTKLVRKSVLRPRGSLKKLLKTSRRPSFCKQLFKLNRTRASSECSIFKTFSRTKIVRKSVLRAHIDSRKLLRKSLNCSVTNLLEIRPLVNSKYKLVLERGVSKKQTDSNVSLKRSPDKPIFNKAKRRRSVIAKITSKLRKNNQHCVFYNRFGRCKGKDRGTCNKVHDPLYVSICKKLPFGVCTDQSCLLSHDVRPGKMPTCYHYLAGICKRESCPFLHIKVNPKAPICRSFLQGFCPDVYNCLKRHEYVCPVFAEKGTCSKGKSCAHPHKIPTVHSKLLADHQRPLMARKRDPAPPPPPPVTRSESCIFLVSEDPEPPVPNLSDNLAEPSSEPPAFTRYFSMPIPSVPVSSPFRPPSSPCSEPNSPERSAELELSQEPEPNLSNLLHSPTKVSQDLSNSSHCVSLPTQTSEESISEVID